MRQALELALEALETCYAGDYSTGHVIDPSFDEDAVKEAIIAIKEALAQPEQPKVRTGDCLLVGVCASEGHKIQAEQEPWRESASDYERGFIDGMQKQMQSSVDKAVNRLAQPDQDEVDIRSRLYQRIHELETQLAQPEQEPVAYLSNKRQRINIELKPQTFVEIPTVTDWEMPLYMKPPQRTWVGLTDEEIADCAEKMEASDPTDSFWREFFRGIEAKLKEKNNG